MYRTVSIAESDSHDLQTILMRSILEVSIHPRPFLRTPA